MIPKWLGRRDENRVAFDFSCWLCSAERDADGFARWGCAVAGIAASELRGFEGDVAAYRPGSDATRGGTR